MPNFSNLSNRNESNRSESNRNQSKRIEFRVRIKFESFTVFELYLNTRKKLILKKIKKFLVNTYWENIFKINFFQTRKIILLRFLSMLYKKVPSINFNKKKVKKIKESITLIHWSIDNINVKKFNIFSCFLLFLIIIR